MQIAETLSFMTPVEFGDGIGFTTIVRLTTGRHALISEVRRGEGVMRVDETMVFACDEVGNVSDWSELHCVRYGTTADAIADVRMWRPHG